MLSTIIDDITINWTLLGFPSIGEKPVPGQFGISKEEEKPAHQRTSCTKYLIALYVIVVFCGYIYCFLYPGLDVLPQKLQEHKMGLFFFIPFLPLFAIFAILSLLIPFSIAVGSIGMMMLGIMDIFEDKKKRAAQLKQLSKQDLYKKAFENYWDNKKVIERKYRDIEKDSYDFEKYVKPRAIGFILKMKSFIEYSNQQRSETWWYSLDGYQFEQEVAKWYQRQGFFANVTQKSGDGGVDIIVKDSANVITYVQCKHYTKNKVDAPTLQQLYGAAVADNAQCAIACLLGLTPQAQVFADKVGVKIVTLKDLLGYELPTSGGQLSLFDQDGNPTKPLPLPLSTIVVKEDLFSIKVGDLIISTNIGGTAKALENTMRSLPGESQTCLFFRNVFFAVSSSELRISDLNRYMRYHQ